MKEKTKVNNQQKLGKDPMQRGLMTMKWQSMITKNLSFATNQLVMCGKDEELKPNVVACWKIAMVYTHYKVMDTCW